MEPTKTLDMTVAQIGAMRGIVKLEGTSRITAQLEQGLKEVEEDNIIPTVAAMLDGIMHNVDTMWEVDIDFVVSMGSPYSTANWADLTRKVAVILPESSFELCSALVWGGTYRIAIEAVEAGAIPEEHTGPIKTIQGQIDSLKLLFPLPPKLKKALEQEKVMENLKPPSREFLN